VLRITKGKVGVYSQQVINAESKQRVPENTWLIRGRVFTPGQPIIEGEAGNNY
jgi:hypothetical protein